MIPSAPRHGKMRERRTWLIAIAAAVLALAVRLPADEDIAPFDELYHWKRVVYSVQHFPQVLEFDIDRGAGGAFTPWPPLYDLSAAAVARLAGAREADEVLRVIRWIPPVLTAILVGLATSIIARGSILAGAIAAVPLAAGPFLAVASSPGDIDHHFLEPFLVLAIAGATVLLSRARDRRSGAAAALCLGAALVAAMFVQTALILAAALCFISLFGRDRLATTTGAAAFSCAALAVLAYRITRPEGFPDGPWFLGWTHVALLSGAALALLLAPGGRPAALVAGGLLAAAIPGVVEDLAGGARFLGGDAWLNTIDEFAPVWHPLSRVPNYVAGLGAGAIASLLLIGRSRHATIIAIFTLAYIAATLPSRRFSTIATVLATVAGSMAVEALYRAHHRAGSAAMGLLVVVVPVVQLTAWRTTVVPPMPHPSRFEAAARQLRIMPGDGGILGPWSYGHMFGVIGGRPVVIDNFGTMGGGVFHEAHAVVLSSREADVAAFCDRVGARFVVLDAPHRGVPQHARVLTLPMESFFRDGAPTAHARATWYWRAASGDVALTQFRRVSARDGVVVLERDQRGSLSANLQGASDGT